MSFPDEVLAPEEELVLHLHQHARIAVRPVLVLVAALATVILAWVMLPPNDGGLIGVGVVALICGTVAVRSGVRPLLQWRCRHYVLTDERVLLQDGVIARERRDLPLNRVNDHVLSQSVLDRVFGSGTLRIDSIGEQSAVLVSVPHAHHVQRTLYELIESAPEDRDEEEQASYGRG